MRRPIIAGNWKMNKTVREAQELVIELRNEVTDILDIDIVVCPPFTSLRAVGKILQSLQRSNIQLGAQNVHWEESGAYTGEISALMLKEVGCRYVIVGHSERRAYFGETNETVNKRAKAALTRSLTPIICVGERLEERESGKTFEVVEAHIEGALQGIGAKAMQSVVIAYEPVWAIGTGKTATPEQAQEAHNYIRKLLKELYNEQVAYSVRIQYGGSVKPDNIADLMAKEDVDGALVGGASLELDSFVKIVRGTK